MWDDPVLYDLENADDPAFDLPFWQGLVERLAPRRVLELACGTGRVTLPLARMGIAESIVGLDSSPRVLDVARAAARHECAAVCDVLEFVEGDMRAPALDGPFDLVAIPFNSLAYVHGTADRAATLAAARALLAPGGRFAFDVVAPRYDLLAEALAPDPEPQVDVDHPAPCMGAARIQRTCTDTYDPATQTLRSANRYEIHWEDGRVEHRENQLDWHIAFPAQLEAELALAGLRPIERFGGWNGEPWDDAARRILWVCEAAA
jgi:SAM-dependent methyltransferase